MNLNPTLTVIDLNPIITVIDLNSDRNKMNLKQNKKLSNQSLKETHQIIPDKKGPGFHAEEEEKK